MSRGHLTYRLALRAYPAAYRADRGDEILTTLLDVCGERRLPDAREVAALLVDGFRRRAVMGPSGRAASWRSGALLAAYVLATVNAAVALLGVILENRLAASLDFGVPGFGPRLDVLGLVITPWFAAFAASALAALVALALGARRTATVAAVVGLAAQLFELVRTPDALVPGGHFAVYAWTNSSSLPRDPSHWLLPSLLLPLLIAGAGAPARRGLRSRLALASGLVAGAGAIALLTSHVWGAFVILLVPLVALTVLSALGSPIDPRPAIACLPLLAAAAPLTWTYVIGDSTTPAAGGRLLLVALPVAAALLAVAALRSIRRRPRAPRAS